MQLVVYLDITMTHIFREGNTVVDSIAKHGARGVTKIYHSREDIRLSVKSCWLLDT